MLLCYAYTLWGQWLVAVNVFISDMRTCCTVIQMFLLIRAAGTLYSLSESEVCDDDENTETAPEFMWAVNGHIQATIQICRKPHLFEKCNVTLLGSLSDKRKTIHFEHQHHHHHHRCHIHCLHILHVLIQWQGSQKLRRLVSGFSMLAHLCSSVVRVS